MSELTIDDLAAASGIPSRTIRFYQSKKLLPKPTQRGRVAFYGDEHAERLKLIAELQDRGLQIKAIGQLLERVDKGELAPQEWLGLDDQLKQPWAEDAPRVVDLAALATLAGALPPGRTAELVRVGLIDRQGDSFLVPSPALLGLALRLERTGVELDVVVAAARLLRKRLARTAEDLAELFLKPRARKRPLGNALKELRPAALDATRLIFGQEMDRVLREWVGSGKTARLSR